MIKINLTEEIIRRHQKYFYDVVDKKLNLKLDGLTWNAFFNKQSTKKNSLNMHTMDDVAKQYPREYDVFEKFMNFCHLHKDTIAVGKMYELKQIQQNLEDMFNFFSGVKLLSEAVTYAFDYEAFSASRENIKSLLQQPRDVVHRKWCAYTFVISLGLRVCPYCNEQYIAPTLTKDGRLRGDIDHFLSKDKYPYFALSLYNMIPCCKFCNSSLKGRKDFSNAMAVTPYEISYNDCFTFKAVQGNDKWLIETDAENQKESGDKVKDILKMFLIKERYQHHADIVEEYLHKEQEYSGRLKENIKKAYSVESLRYFLSDYFGYPLEVKDIEKNVLNKFKRDIAKGLLQHPIC